MGCGGSKKILNGNSQNPVQLGTASRTATAEKQKRTKKTDAVKLVFHCEVCGKTSPNRVHSCPGSKPVGYQETRKSWCARCSYREDDVCTLYKSIHPDRDCIISVGIAMPEAKCPAGFWPKVLLRCSDCGSISFDENGVSQCPVCKKSVKRECSLPWKFTATDEPLEPARPRCVITIAAGQRSLDLLSLTGPAMQEYADRVNADFHVIMDNKEPRYPTANKFRLRTLTEKYDRVLFLDADVFVRQSSPDVFQLVPENTIGIHSDSPYLTDKLLPKSESLRIANEQQIAPVKLHILNTGVVVFDGKQSSIWESPSLPANPRNMTEQTWVECNIHRKNIPITFLPEQFNTQWWFKDFDKLESSAYFVHLAGCPHDERLYRLTKMTQHDKMIM